MSIPQDSVPVMLCDIDAQVLANARQQDRASFFEDEGLAEFLHLQWDIEVDGNLVQEFIGSYHVTKRTVTMSMGEIAIDDELLREVFHLPVGSYKMPKRKRNKFVSSPYFNIHIPHGEQRGWVLSSCKDTIWQDRFSFLHLLLSIKTWWHISVPYYFIEFFQAEGKKRDWLDAFVWFFKAEISRVKLSTAEEVEPSTSIGTHISLILAHIDKKKRLQAVGTKQTRESKGQLTPEKTDSPCLDSPIFLCEDEKGDEYAHEELEGENYEEMEEEATNHPPLIIDNVEAGEEVEKESTIHSSLNIDNAEAGEEVEKDPTIHSSLNIDNMENQILKHHDVGRQGITLLLNRMAGLRRLLDLGKIEYGNRLARLRIEKESLKKEVEKWKNEWEKCKSDCGHENDSLKKELEKWKNESEKWRNDHCEVVEQARELEAKVKAFCTTVISSSLTRTRNERDSSLSLATPPFSKILRARKLPKTENEGN